MDYRNLDIARWPQEPRVEWERETLDCDSSPYDYMDPAEDAERLAAYHQGQWCMIGLRAKATVYIPVGRGSFSIYELTSPGLWSIESDIGEDYLADVYEEEKAQLVDAFAEFGKLAVWAAFIKGY